MEKDIRKYVTGISKALGIDEESVLVFQYFQVALNKQQITFRIDAPFSFATGFDEDLTNDGGIEKWRVSVWKFHNPPSHERWFAVAHDRHPQIALIKAVTRHFEKQTLGGKMN